MIEDMIEDMIENTYFSLPRAVKGEELVDIIKRSVDRKGYKVKIKDVPIDLDYGLIKKEIRIVPKNPFKRIGFVGVFPELGHNEMNIEVFPNINYAIVEVHSPIYMTGDSYLGSEKFNKKDAEILAREVQDMMTNIQ